MKYLLDTHAWIWLVQDADRLSKAAAKVINAAPGQVLGLSAISPWEVAKKVEMGKLKLPCPVGQWIQNALAPRGILLLPLTPEIAVDACGLPGGFHRDPADQIIVATARVHGLAVLTSDDHIRRYPHVLSLW